MMEARAHGRGTVLSTRRRRSAPERDGGAELLISLGASLMTLTNLMRRTTASRFQRLYDLSLVDGWVITRLGPDATISLEELAYRSGLAKSQMSRSVSNVVARGLVSRTVNPKYKAEVILSLTAKGHVLYDRIVSDIPMHHDLLVKGFSEDEVRLLTGFVERLLANSRRNLREEQQYARGARCGD